MKRLIVNADDFGYSSDINRGIITAHKNGVVTTASIIVTKQSFQEAIDLVKKNPKLATGIHFDLDRFFNVDHEKGVVGEYITPQPSSVEVASEMRKQIKLLKSTGVALGHITSHHHAHLRREILPVVCSIAQEYNIRAIRFFRKFYQSQTEYDELKNIIEQHKLVHTQHFIEGWYWGNIDEEFVTAELMTHPGYGELWREYELSACCDPRLKDYLREKNIQLITFNDLLQQ